MTDVQNTPELDQAISSLKKQADRLGITYKSNVSYATLQKAIQEKLEQPGESQDETVATAVPQTKGKTPEDLHKEAMQLVRVIITPMDPVKAANMDSDVFCAGNKIVGTVKRVIPFNEPWHVERILLNSLREKQTQVYTTKKNAKGHVDTIARTVPAFNVVELPALTQEEIDQLAERQVRTRALEDE